jgi:hypothetical protein
MITVTSTINQFDRFIGNFVSNSRVSTLDVVRGIGFTLMRRVVLRTPVDTGRARAGWSAAGSALGVPVPPSSHSQPGDSAYSEKIENDKISLTAANNVFYINLLEFGWSPQAPLGMVRISVLEMSMGNKIPQVLGHTYQALWSGGGKARFAMQKEIFDEGMREAAGTANPSRLAATLSAIKSKKGKP